MRLLSVLLGAGLALSDASAPVRPNVVAARKALAKVLSDRPQVKVLRMTELDAEAAGAERRRADPESRIPVRYGFLLRCAVADDQVAALTSFREDLRKQQVLFPTVIVNVDWRMGRGRERVPEQIEFSLVLLGGAP